MITDEQAEKANDWIRDNATQAAQAKSNRLHLEEFRKAKKAELFLHAPGGTVADKEAFAYSHPDYLALLDGYRVAVEEDERMRWMMEAAALRVEIWRTQSANNRRGI